MSTRIVTHIGRRDLEADLGAPISLAVPLSFDEAQPNAFFVPRATATPVRVGSYVGDTRIGGSSNCYTVSLTAHGNGTHTECVAHIVDDPVTIDRILPGGLYPACVVTVGTRPFGETPDTYGAPALPSDDVVTRDDLRAAIDSIDGALDTRALVVRMESGSPDLETRTWSGNSPAYFTREAMRWVADGPWNHLVTEMPSLDRDDDDGAMINHRAWWGVPAGVGSLDGAAPSRRTVTEMARVPDAARDGLWLLTIEIPPFALDAAPSRPILYPLRPIA